MKVQILGTGCPRCRALSANAEQAIAELGVAAEIEKVERIADIARMGVAITPALAVDGVVRSAGHILSVGQVKEILAPGSGNRPR